MKPIQLLTALSGLVFLGTCTSGRPTMPQASASTKPAASRQDCVASGKPAVTLTVTQIPPQCPLQGPFVKYLNIFGVNILATASVSDEKMLHAGNVMAQYLDNDEDGTPDDPKVLEMLTQERATLVMSSEAEFEQFTEGELPEDVVFQDLLVDETLPEFHKSKPYGDQSRFDGSLEEVLHLVQSVGWARAYPEVFAAEPGSQLAEAMDKARGGHFEELPAQYPAEAWYSYDDETCDYGCQVIEYAYWVTTSLLGAQEYPGRAEEVGEEWKLTKVADLKAKDQGWKVIASAQYRQPTKKLPDGNYRGPVAD